LASTVGYGQVPKDWFAGRGENNWILSVNGEDQPAGTDWQVRSRFGSVRPVAVLDKDGNPTFDRPEYREAPNVNVVAWGRDHETGEILIGIISQPRPHPDDPEHPESSEALVFGQIPMGFMDKLVGKDLLDQYESGREAAARETGEETGASVILNIEQPHYPWHNPNPTFCATWSDLYFVEVDLAKIEELKEDRSEPIFKAVYLPVRSLIGLIATGQLDQGAEIFRSCTANSAWLIFFTTHPDFWPQKG